MRAAGSRADLIVIDEIQRLPSLLNTVQSLADDPAAKCSEIRRSLAGSIDDRELMQV